MVARIVAPSGKTETVRSAGRRRAVGRVPGALHAQRTGQAPGHPGLPADLGDAGDASFSVQGQLIEQVGRPARPDVLEELAMVSKGKSVAPRRNRANHGCPGRFAHAATVDPSAADLEPPTHRRPRCLAFRHILGVEKSRRAHITMKKRRRHALSSSGEVLCR